MAEQTNNGFGGFGFNTVLPKNNSSSSSTFGMWTPDMLDTSKDKKIKELEKKNQQQEVYIGQLIKFLDDKETDIGLKNQQILELQKQVQEFKMKEEEQNATCVITNIYSIRTAKTLLNLQQNYQLISDYVKAIVYSNRAKQYFTCVKLYNGSWIEGSLYTNPIHNFPQIELIE